MPRGCGPGMASAGSRLTPPGPGLRRHIKLAYDSARGRLVLYGGYDFAGTRDSFRHLGVGWSALATTRASGARSTVVILLNLQMTSLSRKRVLLFGGLSADGPKNDTWSWDGDGWDKMSDAGPSPRGEAGAVFEETARQVVVSGGMAYDVRPVDDATVPARHGPAVALDTRRKRVVLFGGSAPGALRCQISVGMGRSPVAGGHSRTALAAVWCDAVFDSRCPNAANADTTWLTIQRRLSAQSVASTGIAECNRSRYCRTTRLGRSQDDNPDLLAWRVRANVREIEIHCEQDPARGG